MFHRLLAGGLLATGLLLSLAQQPAAAADSNNGGNCGACGNCNAPCAPCLGDVKYWGFSPTRWRQWPGTEQQPVVAKPPAAPPGAGVPGVEPPPRSKEFEKPPTDTSTSQPNAMPPDAFPPPQGNLPPDNNPNKNPAPNNPGGNKDAPPAKQPGANNPGPDKVNQFFPGQNPGSRLGSWTEMQGIAADHGPSQRIPENILRSPMTEAPVQWSGGATMPQAIRPDAAGPAASPASANRPAGLINPERNPAPAADRTVDQASYTPADVNFNVLRAGAETCSPTAWPAGTDVTGPMLIPAGTEACRDTAWPGVRETSGPALIPAGAEAIRETPAWPPADAGDKEATLSFVEPRPWAGPASAAEPCRPAAIPARMQSSEPAAASESVQTAMPGSEPMSGAPRPWGPMANSAAPNTAVPNTAAYSSSLPTSAAPNCSTFHVNAPCSAPAEAEADPSGSAYEGVAARISFSPLRDAFPKIHLRCDDGKGCEPAATAQAGNEEKSPPPASPIGPAAPTQIAAAPVATAPMTWSPLRDAFPKCMTRVEPGETGDISKINPLEIEANLATEGVPATRTPPACNALPKEPLPAAEPPSGNMPAPPGRMPDGRVQPASCQQVDSPKPAKLSDIDPLEVGRSQRPAPAAPAAIGH